MVDPDMKISKTKADWHPDLSDSAKMELYCCENFWSTLKNGNY